MQPELAELVNAWPSLPKGVSASLLMLVQASKKSIAE
jgi:hypothetical protein